MKRLAVLGVLALAAGLSACMGVSNGPEPVVFRGQTDLIVWDRERGIEHFVRNARFDAKEDVAFLAPTPSVPEISTATDAAFKQLTEIALPDSKKLRSRGEGGFGGGGTPEPKSAVTVVELMDVGSYTAAVLQAGDAAALRGWLKANEFPAPDWMEAWVKPYLDSGWTITAFKLKKGATKATGPIRMTFKTDVPFAPYAVPKENGGAGSKLRLFLVSDVPLQGEVGGHPWATREVGRAVLDEGAMGELAGNLGLQIFDLPSTAQVRVFDDPNFGKEPRNDLFFERIEGENDRAKGVFLALVAPGTVGVLLRRRPTSRAKL